MPAVFTIHNLAFQGVFGREVLAALGLGWDVFITDALEFWGNVSLLKGGVNFSEKITTVSPTYAREILTPAFGLRFRRHPPPSRGTTSSASSTASIPSAGIRRPIRSLRAFSADDLAGEAASEARAARDRSACRLDDGALARPVIGIISRLTDQKGFDLVASGGRAS